MSSEILLTANGLGKRYEIYSSPYKRLLQMICMGHRNFYRKFDALSGLDLQVKRGECVGIIGRNGAGKSTLLSLLSGTRHPSSGTLETKGKVSALLELGYGFNPDFTGRENIAVSGLMQGMSPEELKEKTEEIIRFADIGEFIDHPVKKYSSGMHVRLAFAIAAHVSSEILLVDEALAVGDIFFQQKCYRFLEERKKNSALLLVSHDLNAVSTLCDRVLVLEKGEKVFEGSPREAIEFYTHLLYEPANREAAEPEIFESGMEPIIPEKRAGSHGAFLASSLNKTVLHAGDKLQITGQAELYESCKTPIFGFFFNDKFGKRVFGNCMKKNETLMHGKVSFSFELKWPDIAPGEYTLTLGIGSGEDVMAQEVFCWATDFRSVTTLKEKEIVHGVFNVEMNCFSLRSSGI